MTLPQRLAASSPGWTTYADVVVIGSGIAGLSAALDGVETVVHLVASVIGTDEQRLATAAAGTERLIEALTGSAVRRLVLASSYAVYDWSRLDSAVDAAARAPRQVERDVHARQRRAQTARLGTPPEALFLLTSFSSWKFMRRKPRP